MTILLIFLHICAAILVSIGWYRGMLHIPSSMIALAVLLPLWGPLCAAAAEIHFRNGEKGDEDPETGRFGITDEVYRSIRMVNDDISAVRPIEDVLEQGTPAQRRSLLLSVLHTGAEPFVRPLRAAGVNDDTEVVHYAVTALVEMRSDYNQRIARMEAELQNRPMDTGVLLASADLDEAYLRSGIPENTEREERMAHCRAVLEKLLQNTSWERQAGMRGRTKSGEESPEPFSPLQRTSLLSRLGKICLAQKDVPAAEKIGETLIRELPDREDGYLLLLEAKAAARSGTGISEIIDTIRRRNIYLSPEARERIRFWSV